MRRRPLTLAVLALGAIAASAPAGATWKPQYADAAPAVQDWYRNAQLTAAAQQRFGFKSCCAHSDVVKTRFRVDRGSGADVWQWWHDGAWDTVPADIIHFGESAPDGQPTLFALGSTPTCFFPGDSGQ
jgi:hypothetical protein